MKHLYFSCSSLKLAPLRYSYEMDGTSNSQSTEPGLNRLAATPCLGNIRSLHVVLVNSIV